MSNYRNAEKYLRLPKPLQQGELIPPKDSQNDTIFKPCLALKCGALRAVKC